MIFQQFSSLLGAGFDSVGVDGRRDGRSSSSRRNSFNDESPAGDESDEGDGREVNYRIIGSFQSETFSR